VIFPSVLAGALRVAALALILCAGPAHGQFPLSRAELRGLHAEALTPGLASDSVTHSSLYRGLTNLVARGGLRQINLGRSAEGRRLAAFIAGGGPKRLLLWSQSHGDAEIGTMALADLLTFLSRDDGDDLAKLLRDSLTIVALPMVNPDGAEIGARRNSHGVDILLDGRRGATPEGRVLTRAAGSIPNTIAIGLERQGSGIPSGTAVSLTVPAARQAESQTGAGGLAIQVANHLASALAEQSAALPMRRESPFDARSVPDILQNDFRSVVVMGLDASAQDASSLRSASFTALLSLLQALASGSLEAEPGNAYASLPTSDAGAATQSADLLIRRVRLRVPSLPTIVADVAIDFADAAAGTGGRVVDVGDLAVAARDTLDEPGLIVDVRPAGVEATGKGHFRLAAGTLADLNVLQRTRTLLRTPYQMRGGVLSQPMDHRFPRRAKWFVSLQPPFLTQEVSRHYEDVELALDEVGWTDPARPGGNGSARTPSAFQVSLGRTVTGSVAVELVGGMADRWSTRRSHFDSTTLELVQSAAYGGVLLSYEYRNLRFGGGPAISGHGWEWSTLGTGATSSSGRVWSFGALWEASLALPAGTRWAPELRVQYRRFQDVELEGYGAIPDFPVRQSTFAIGLGTTFRWWDGD
jgi:hypothetical protein